MGPLGPPGLSLSQTEWGKKSQTTTSAFLLFPLTSGGALLTHLLDFFPADFHVEPVDALYHYEESLDCL